MNDLGLNNHHTDVVANYLSFTKLQRVTNLKTIDGLFQDVFDSRLYDSSYTVDEVQDILYSLRKSVKGELESGLMDLNHMNVLLLEQLFSQAEKWHLHLEVNLSELQNRSLLEKVRDIDQNGFAPLEERIKKSDDPNDPVSLLQIEIRRLKKDASAFEGEIKRLNEKLEAVNNDNHQLNDQLRASLLTEGKGKLKLLELEEKIGALQNQLKDSLNKNTDTQTNADMLNTDNSELSSLKENLQQTQSRLKLAEQELDRKFKETTAFTNMKKLLDSKNEQMRILREKLKNVKSAEENDSDVENLD